jgi:hypothetical protein
MVDEVTLLVTVITKSSPTYRIRLLGVFTARKVLG